jgi:hypothetical protein
MDLYVLRLAVAVVLVYLVLVLTLSSGTQAQVVASSEGAVAAAGQDCAEFEDEADDGDTNELQCGHVHQRRRDRR